MSPDKRKIEYRAVVGMKDDGVRVTRDFRVRVDARSINSGWTKAVREIKRRLRRDDELVSVEFWQVLS